MCKGDKQAYLLFRSIRKFIQIDKEHHKKLAKTVHNYNDNKVGVDILD